MSSRTTADLRGCGHVLVGSAAQRTVVGVSVSSVTTGLAVLAVLAAVVGACALLLVLVPVTRRRSARWRARFAYPTAAAVAVVATAGSLYLSEVAHFTPCRLCWYQRGAMYPLAVVLSWGALTGRRSWRPWGMVHAALGACISSWHVLVELYPTLESGSCDPFNPCSIRWLDVWGVFTIPTMALIGFVTIFTLLAVAAPRDTVRDVDVSSSPLT